MIEFLVLSPSQPKPRMPKLYSGIIYCYITRSNGDIIDEYDIYSSSKDHIRTKETINSIIVEHLEKNIKYTDIWSEKWEFNIGDYDYYSMLEYVMYSHIKIPDCTFIIGDKQYIMHFDDIRDRETIDDSDSEGEYDYDTSTDSD
jgi:hypothetical protein